MKLAETVQIVVFGAETETEFRSVSSLLCDFLDSVLCSNICIIYAVAGWVIRKAPGI